MSRSSLIEVRDLEKTFRVGWRRKRVEAVRKVSFEVRQGEIFGLVGPNGAGKTTTIKMITGLIKADQGRIQMFGESLDLVSARRQLGYLPEGPYFYEHLNVRELLKFYGQLHGIDNDTLRQRSDRLIERVGLGHAVDRPIRKFSKGMRQRAGLAQALINDPRLVILDEPQSGLDPVGRKEVRDLIFELKDEGKTVFFSSHILPDVEAVCDRVAVMHKGVIEEIGSLHELTSERTKSLEILLRDVDPQDFAGHQSASIRRIHTSGEMVLLEAEPDIDLGALLAYTHKLGGELYALTPQKENLEDVFMRDTYGKDAAPSQDSRQEEE